jgi:hypothetical protein
MPGRETLAGSPIGCHHLVPGAGAVKDRDSVPYFPAHAPCRTTDLL